MPYSQIKKYHLKKAINTAFILFTVILATQACNLERHIARKILTTNDSIKVCLIDPIYVIKQNMKTWEIPNYDSLPQNTRDSLLFFNSRYLQFVNDSVFLTTYSITIKEELKKYGIGVYTQDSMDVFLSSGGRAYLFNTAQVSLEEYMEPVKKTFGFDTANYKWEIWCNAVAMNIWYEANVLNVTDTKMQVLYANMFVRDKVTGHFEGDFYNGDVNYVYKLDTISTKSVYNLARKAATTYAQYIFDFILNDQIARKANPSSPPAEYMHYDPEKRKLRKAGTQRFVIMK